MTKTAKEILEKAIQKAIDGGWESPDTVSRVAEDLSNDCNCYGSLYDIVFDHDFAKALWGDTPIHNMGGAVSYITHWQYHLQQMVIADDPIRYLEESI